MADEAPQAAPQDAPAKPARVVKSAPPVRLTHPYGYIDEDGARKGWAAGTVVTDAAEIADLMARKAPIEEVTDAGTSG